MVFFVPLGTINIKLILSSLFFHMGVTPSILHKRKQNDFGICEILAPFFALNFNPY